MSNTLKISIRLRITFLSTRAPDVKHVENVGHMVDEIFCALYEELREGNNCASY